jgi:hypothetical protein
MTGQLANNGNDVDHCEGSGLSLAGCPEHGCMAPANLYAEAELGGTAGPVRHARTCCLNRHHFQLPVSQIPGLAADNGEPVGRHLAGAPGAQPRRLR